MLSAFRAPEPTVADVLKRSFSLPAEQAAFIDQMAASGQYVPGSEVVREGLRAMQQRTAAIERWLRDEVAPSYDHIKANPDVVISMEELERHLQARFETYERGVK